MRQRSKPARSELPSGTSSTFTLPSSPTTKTSTDKLISPVDHAQTTAVHVVPTAARPWSPEPLTTRSAEVQRRSLLCNRVLVFEDTGELLPDGRIVAPHRPLALTVGSAA
ncbi:DUF5999 family protein [Streptomyces sp. NBC_01213]|nr:DUF5999 family protein [Streptomyces sp. NBC_01213]